MALLAQKRLAGFQMLTKREGRHAVLCTELVTVYSQSSFVSRLLGPLQTPSAHVTLSTNDSNACVHSTTADARSREQTSEQARQRVVSNSEASTSQPQPLPALHRLKGWPNGGGMVDQEAHVHSSAVIEYGAVVQMGAVIEKDVHIGACSVVGPNVTLGEKTVLWHNVSLQHCTIGRDCILHNGVSIGQDGFGFFVNEKGEMVKKPQELKVIIGNNVEIGANSCIDRGSWRDTEIGDHTKIDNLVQVGHNVKIGRCCLLCGHAAVGGSAELGDYVVMGGKAGVADHVKVHSQVRLAAKTGVTSDINEKGDYAGFPAVPAREWRRSIVAVRKLGRDVRKILSHKNLPDLPKEVA